MSQTFNYGGQAVIEGVMMRGQQNIAIAVRRPDGEIDVVARPLASLYKGRLRNLPLVRGVIVLIETLVLGIQALMHSAQVAVATEPGQEEEMTPAVLWGTLAIGMAFGVGLFFVVPLLLTRFLVDPYISSALLSNIIEGVVRIGIFIIYLKLISLMKDIKRVFAYHGAEHKTVNAYEAGVPLEVNAVKAYSTAHSRCGTGFLLVVLVISIFVFALLGRPVLWLSIISRIVLLPVIAAIGYEIIRFNAAHHKNILVRAMLVPGMALQSLTTGEPDDSQLETAISALKKVMEVDKS